MALSPKERTRRHRAHHRGDHSLCDPKTCHALRPETEDPVTRGDRLVAQLQAERTLTPAEQALAREAGRLVDRLDRLHAHLDDRHWLRFEVGELSERGAVTVIVKLDRVLAEARQQQDTLRSLVGELRQHRAAAKAESPTKKPKGAGLADLIDLASRR